MSRRDGIVHLKSCSLSKCTRRWIPLLFHPKHSPIIFHTSGSRYLGSRMYPCRASKRTTALPGKRLLPSTRTYSRRHWQPYSFRILRHHIAPFQGLYAYSAHPQTEAVHCSLPPGVSRSYRFLIEDFGLCPFLRFYSPSLIHSSRRLTLESV